MSALGALPLVELGAAIAARTPAPGGGAAAAGAAALGCAAGAMAARFTTGAKWADRAPRALALAERLDAWRARALQLADDDAQAFAAAQAAHAAGDPVARAAADARAAQVPLALAALAGEAATALAGFLAACNPRLRSDVAVGVHLLVGAGRAAWRTALENAPSEPALEQGRQALAALDAAERTALADRP